MSAPHLSDAEWKVMNAVWAEHPTKARAVMHALEDETAWKYSTVKTMLERLVEKGALEAHMEGITTLYTPAMTREEAQRDAVRSLAEKAFGGALGSMAHFFMQDEQLSAKDRKALQKLLAERSKRGRK